MRDDAAASPPRTQGAVDYASQRLKAMLDLGRFAPGAKLPTAAELAAELDVSRPVVLQALQVLASQGRVTVRRGSGAWVSGLTGDSLDRRRAQLWQDRRRILDMCVLREMLEVGVARRLAERGLPADAEREARSLLAEIRASDDRTVHRRLDVEFHDLLARACEAPAVYTTLHEARTVVAATYDVLPWPQGRQAASDDEHDDLLAAIVAGDPECAATSARVHVGASTTLITQLLGGDGTAVLAEAPTA